MQGLEKQHILAHLMRVSEWDARARFSERFVMASTEETGPPASRPGWLRLLLAVPVIGWIARDLLDGSEDTIWYALAAFFGAWIMAIVLFGIPGLYIPAVILVPIILIVMVVGCAGG